jgi:phage baseplate assembly protein W
MRSFHFPDMIKANSSNVWKSSEFNNATKQNTTLLLQSERGELFGDPYFGLMLQHYLFNQNSVILRDAIIDTIYTQLALFIPQVRFNRNDIEIIQDKQRGKLICKCSGISQIDYTTNTYDLVLFEESDM